MPLPLPPSVSRALVRGDSDKTHQPKLKQSRGASSAASSAPSDSNPTPEEVGIPSDWQRSFMVGNVVMLFGLTSRRELKTVNWFVCCLSMAVRSAGQRSSWQEENP